MLSNDIELFWEFKNFKRINAFVVGITGTNGKSTIALLISRALQTIPLGNFGNPILDNLNFKKNNFVIELSSFQLQYINKFKPNISIISNIQIDHLNYHRTFKKYLKAKFNILKNQNEEDFVIINYDDENIREFLKAKNKLKSQIVRISCKALKNGFILNNSLQDLFYKIFN